MTTPIKLTDESFMGVTLTEDIVVHIRRGDAGFVVDLGRMVRLHLTREDMKTLTAEFADALDAAAEEAKR